MDTLHHVQALREALAGPRRAGQRIALVPTMGNLHAGHLALVA
ncbi:MAG: pantoate--beta-alanine ligase, partial [Onishia taeanensis]